MGHRSFGGEDPEVLRNLHHRALDKQAVNARGLFERIGQSAPGVGIELQGNGAEMQIEIEQRRGLVALFRQNPRAGNRGHRRTDTTAAADERDDLAEASPNRRRRAAFLQSRGQRLAAYRLHHVIGRAGREEIAEKRDVIDHAERDDLDVLATHSAGRAELGDRRRRIAEIDDQNARILTLAHPPQCRIERCLKAQLVIQVQLTDDRLDAFEGGLILKDRDNAHVLGFLRGRLLGNCGNCTHY